MVVYEIRGSHIRLRQTTGDQFEFAVEANGEWSWLRLARPPRWNSGVDPHDAEFRVYLAHAAARGIAQGAGILI